MKLFVVLLIVAIVALDVGLVIPAQAQGLPNCLDGTLRCVLPNQCVTIGTIGVCLPIPCEDASTCPPKNFCVDESIEEYGTKVCIPPFFGR